MGDLADRDMAIEAVIESLEEKLSVFRAMDKVMAPNAILATNTSSIPIITLGSITSRSDMVLGMHFFNPAPIQPLVELVRSLGTSLETIDRVDRFAVEVLGKRVIRCRDRAGFVVNRLLVPYLLDAIRMFDEGKVSAADIDSGMMYGCGHPMGPLTLCDLIGLDTIEAVADVLYEEFKGSHNAPPPAAAAHGGRRTPGPQDGQGLLRLRKLGLTMDQAAVEAFGNYLRSQRKLAQLTLRELVRPGPGIQPLPQPAGARSAPAFGAGDQVAGHRAELVG